MENKKCARCSTSLRAQYFHPPLTVVKILYYISNSINYRLLAVLHVEVLFCNCLSISGIIASTLETKILVAENYFTEINFTEYFCQKATIL